MAESEVRVVLVSGPDAETLGALGRVLVEERLAACVNVIPGLTSIYRWDGEVQTETEALAVCKTTEGAVDRVERRIAELHPYDVPEIVAVEVTGGLPAYLRWVAESVDSASEDAESRA